MVQNTSVRDERDQNEFDFGFPPPAPVAAPAPLKKRPAAKKTRRTPAGQSRPRDLDVKELMAQLRKNPAPGETETLSAVEQVWWVNCRETIRVSDRQDVRRALSLLIIHQQQLYRADYPTWAAFARDNYAISRSHAHRLIAYADFLKELKSGDPFPTERQFRILNRLPGTNEQKRQVWVGAAKASRGGLVTRALILKSAEKHLGTSTLVVEVQKEDTAKKDGLIHKRFGLPTALMFRATKAAKSLNLSLDDFVQAAIEAMVARSTVPSVVKLSQAESASAAEAGRTRKTAAT